MLTHFQESVQHAYLQVGYVCAVNANMEPGVSHRLPKVLLKAAPCLDAGDAKKDQKQDELGHLLEAYDLGECSQASKPD